MEWGPEAAEALAKEVGHFTVPGGKDGEVRTLGEYVDKTPKYIMSKVTLEEIAFDTWYGNRTVLLGDGKSVYFFSAGLIDGVSIVMMLTLVNLCILHVSSVF